MDEIISTVVANGIWAVLFCGLLVFELRDSRGREGRYTGMIAELSERLATDRKSTRLNSSHIH